MSFENKGPDNILDVGSKVDLLGWIRGKGNSIKIENPVHECKIDVRISGDNNSISIAVPFAIKGLQVRIGNHVPANHAQLKIAAGFSIEETGQFLLYNSGNKLEIGESCMFSNNVTIRCGDSPHLLFDRETGEYLDVSEGVFIGNHVWIGEKVYVTKKVTIPNECLVAACSVVTRRFDESHCVLAGNPAKMVRKNIQWIRNYGFLENGSQYKDSYYLNQGLYK